MEKKTEHRFDRTCSGGGIGYTYSNSAEALRYSSRCGYDSVEVDVRFTSDNKLVCSHDFNTSYVPSYDEFMTEQYEPRFTTLDFEECISFCRNKGLKMIVDTKNGADVEKVAAYLLKNHQSKDDVWIQIFNEGDISHVDDLNVLYNLTFESDYDRAADFCSVFGVSQVSISTEHLRERKGWEELINRGIDVYAHTVNDRCEYWEWKQAGVRGVFTDRIERKELE